jgi:hypothetical protein
MRLLTDPSRLSSLRKIQENEASSCSVVYVGVIPRRHSLPAQQSRSFFLPMGSPRPAATFFVRLGTTAVTATDRDVFVTILKEMLNGPAHRWMPREHHQAPAA